MAAFKCPLTINVETRRWTIKNLVARCPECDIKLNIKYGGKGECPNHHDVSSYSGSNTLRSKYWLEDKENVRTIIKDKIEKGTYKTNLDEALDNILKKS